MLKATGMITGFLLRVCTNMRRKREKMIGRIVDTDFDFKIERSFPSVFCSESEERESSH